MTESQRKSDGARFFAGLLISSVGGMTFTIGLIVFMMRAGFGLFQISIIIGLSRLIPIVASTLLGDLADRTTAKTMVLCTELAAGLSSIGILWIWTREDHAYLPLAVFTVIRSVVLAIQSGSRNKLVKELSGDGYESNARNAVYFNKATQGAALFAGLLAWLAFEYINFESVIILDAATFFLNGIILLSLSGSGASSVAAGRSSPSITQKFKDLYHYNPRASRLDVFLALAMMGTASFNTRLAADHQEWNPILSVTFGLAVWVAGYLERSKLALKMGPSLWLFFGMSFTSLGFIPAGPGLVVMSFVKDTFYWILFHRITTAIQMDTPKEVIGSVSHARSAQMVAILALGELAVGAWQGVLPLSVDGLWRGMLCCAVGTALCVG